MTTLIRGGGHRLRLSDRFAGAGGATQGSAKVPWLEPVFAANHKKICIDTHQLNFPGVEHYLGDIVEADITRFPYAELAWDSPACPPWTDARGVKRDFDRSNQQILEGLEDGAVADEQTMRMRALMEEIPRNLRHWVERGQPILAGVVENVVQCRKWDEWPRWRREIEQLGYRTRLIALNSMHARAPHSIDAPQSRDRLYLAYWLADLGRDPDWDKWLRPKAYCPSCDEVVAAMQVFKKPGADMGRYGVRHGQYVYRCPRSSCRHRVVEPFASPAWTAIDWTVPGTPIGERKKTKKRPDGLAPNTIRRIKAGLARHAVPVVCPCGGSWRNQASPVTDPMTTRLTRESDGIAVPEGLWSPYIVELRGGNSTARPIADPLATVCASGNHHHLVTHPDWVPAHASMIMRNNTQRGGDGGYLSTAVTEPLRSITTAGHQSLATWEGQQTSLLVPYYTNGTPLPVNGPVGTLSTKDRYALATGSTEIDIERVLYRMLMASEIGMAMAFGRDYIVLGEHDDQVRQYGNAVTPPVAEILMSALVETITGEELERAA